MHWETISVAEKFIEPVSGPIASEGGEIAEGFGQKRLETLGIIPDKTYYSFSKLNLTELQNPNRSETGISISRRGYALWIRRWTCLKSQLGN